MPDADELPLAAHLFFASQQELPESPRLLDLAENWLRQHLSEAIAPPTLLPVSYTHLTLPTILLV